MFGYIRLFILNLNMPIPQNFDKTIWMLKTWTSIKFFDKKYFLKVLNLNQVYHFTCNLPYWFYGSIYRKQVLFCSNLTAECSIRQIAISYYITQNIFLHNAVSDPGFHRGQGQPLSFGRKAIFDKIFAKKCMKMKEIGPSKGPARP